MLINGVDAVVGAIVYPLSHAEVASLHHLNARAEFADFFASPTIRDGPLKQSPIPSNSFSRCQITPRACGCRWREFRSSADSFDPLRQDLRGREMEGGEGGEGVEGGGGGLLRGSESDRRGNRC